MARNKTIVCAGQDMNYEGNEEYDNPPGSPIDCDTVTAHTSSSASAASEEILWPLAPLYFKAIALHAKQITSQYNGIAPYPFANSFTDKEMEEWLCSTSLPMNLEELEKINWISLRLEIIDEMLGFNLDFKSHVQKAVAKHLAAKNSDLGTG